MLTLLRNFFKKPDLARLQICHHGQPPRPFTLEEVVPYAGDHCLSCDQHMCHICAENHMRSYCSVKSRKLIIIASIDEYIG